MTQEPKMVTFAKEEPIGFERTADGKLVISGYSIHTGIFQNDTVEIPYSELSNIADTLKGQKFLKNHDAGDSDAVIGKVVDTKIGLDKEIGKKGVKYKGVIRDAGLEEKIQDGFLDNVSIGFELKPECSACGEDFRYCEHWFDEAHVIARDCRCYEQSIVPFGADGNTTIEPGASFSHDSDFTAQFEYKHQSTSDATKWKYNDATEDTSQWEFTAPMQNIPASNFIYTFVAPNENGDKMEEENKRLKEQVTELQGEITAKDTEIETLTAERDTLASEKAELEATIEEQDGKITELSEAITAYEEAEQLAEQERQEAEEAEKLAAAKEIVGLEKLEDEAAEERLKELIEFDTPALEAIKAAYLSAQPVAEDKPKIGQFHAQKSGVGAMPEKIDVKDPEVKRLALGQMFNAKYQKKEE